MAENISDELYCLFKGEPGLRKSTCALSFPTPQYWISTDRKMNALKIPMKNWGIDAKQVHYDDYTDWNSIRVQLEKFQVSCPYKTIIADSITSIGDVTNNQTKASKSGMTTKAGEEKGMRVGGIPVNTLEDYKAEASAFQSLIALTKDIHVYHKVNIILIAHVIGERNKDDAKQSTHFARIIVTGGKIISAKIPAYCSEIYHFNVESAVDVSKESQYGLLTRHTGDDYARSTLPLPRSIIFGNDPLYDKYVLPAIKQLKEQPSITLIK